MEAHTAVTARDTPLAAVHKRAGAEMGVWFGCALPNHFGDWLAEYRAARDSVALIDKNYRAYQRFTGPDRVRYLNAILTNNIQDLATGTGTVSLLLNPQGHILAEIETYALPDHLFCVSYAMIRERLVETLDKYIIMDDVNLTDEADLFGTLALEGPKSAEAVAQLSGVDLSSLGELSTIDAAVGALPCRITRRSPGGIPGAEFLVARDNLTALWQILAEKVRALGGTPMGYSALSTLRLEQGVPWFGYDFDERHIPHEAGLQDSHISYTKGCYTGQEIVERVRSRGHANRLRVSLKFLASEPPAPGTPLFADAQEVGYVTRTALSPALGCLLGMAYLRREYSTPGTRLTCAAATAEVLKPGAID